jgi:ubiquinone/menaquinone biosynthesis C-methylase UbiE
MKSVLKFLSSPWARSTIGLKNASTRNEWVENALHNLPSGIKILDAGAGECQYRQYCQHLRYVSQDFSKYEGIGNKSGLQMGKWDTSSIDIISDITSIPVPNEEFDAVLCTEVFEHLPDPGLAIREFARILKNGGQLIITAPFVSFTHFAPHHYSTGFSKYYFQYHLTKCGFGDITMVENGNFFEFMGQELRRVRSVSQTYCGKDISFFTSLLIKFLLIALDRMAKSDKGSKEFSNFGFHVIARKITNAAAE